jgi:hypothetical protein
VLTAAVLAADAAFAHVPGERIRVMPPLAPCRPGEFYLRALPPLHAILDDLSRRGPPVVDGYSDRQAQTRGMRQMGAFSAVPCDA